MGYNHQNGLNNGGLCLQNSLSVFLFVFCLLLGLSVFGWWLYLELGLSVCQFGVKFGTWFVCFLRW